jgi:ferredoxin
LWHETSETELPRDLLRAEIAQIVRLGIKVHSNTTVGHDSSGKQPSLDSLANDFDAVLLSCGALDGESARAWGLKTAPRGIAIDRASYQTDREKVFAAGNAVRGKAMVIRSAADGKEAAGAIDRYVLGLPVEGAGRPFTSRMGKVTEAELGLFLAGAGDAPLADAASSDGRFSPTQAVEQSARCLHCDCRALETCKLKRYGRLYGADPNRFKGDRATFAQDVRHSLLIHEPGKCINCGLCIEIASAAGEPLGLSFVGRGFDVRVGVPFDESLEKALTQAAAKAAQACPTAALVLKPTQASTPASDKH